MNSTDFRGHQNNQRGRSMDARYKKWLVAGVTAVVTMFVAFPVAGIDDIPDYKFLVHMAQPKDGLHTSDPGAIRNIFETIVEPYWKEISYHLSDTNSGGTGLALAVILGIPALSWARKIEIEDGRLKVERVIQNGYEIFRGPIPALVTISHEAGEMRLPKLAEIRKAKQKPIHSFTTADLEIEDLPTQALSLIALEEPRRQRKCRIIEGESQSEAGAMLAKILYEDGVL